MATLTGNNCVTDSLVDEIFGNCIDSNDCDRLDSTVIVCTRHDDTFLINDKIVARVNLLEHTYVSLDSVASHTGDDITDFPAEFLYSLTPAGMLQHILNLRKGAVVMLLRNLNISEGLCNGTRLVVVER